MSPKATVLRLLETTHKGRTVRFMDANAQQRARDLKPFDAALKDGRLVRLRPVLADDGPRLAAAFQRMSTRSRMDRFRVPVERLSDAQVRFLTELDYSTHVAWGAVDPTQEGTPGLGVARYVLSPSLPGTAQCAVSVIDEWQGVGLGRLLMETLMCAAAARRVRVLTGPVRPGNAAALALLSSMGAGQPLLRDGLFQVRLPVDSGLRQRRLSLSDHPQIRSGEWPAPSAR